MTGEAQNWIQSALDRYPIAGEVLEIGAFDVNGSSKYHFCMDHPDTHATEEELKARFPRYVGVDILAGPGVDLVCSSHDLVQMFGHECFDVVVSAEMLEHDSAPWLTAAEVAGVLRPGGWLILTTCGFNAPYHHPPDYFRFSLEDLRSLFGGNEMEVMDLQEVNWCPMLVTRKSGA